MRFLYTLAAVVLLSASASAQAVNEQAGLTDSLAMQVISTADLTTTIFNYTDPLPAAYVAPDTNASFYVTPTYFQRVEANGDTTGLGVLITPTGFGGTAVIARNPAEPNGTGFSEGCAAADISNLSELAGKIVMIARGTCTFVIKFQVAEAAGAIGVVVYNPTYRPDNNVLTNGAGGEPEPAIGIPGVLVPNGIGQPIVDEIDAGGNVTLFIYDAEGDIRPIAAEPTVGTTASSLVVDGANPFAATTQLRLTSEFAETVRVEVYNVRGQLVRTLLDGVVAGERTIPMSSEGLAAGVYFVRATGETFRSQQQITVIR